MKVRVQYFAQLKELLDCTHEEVELEQGNTIADLLNQLRQQEKWQQAERELPQIRVAVDLEFVEADCVITPDSEIAFFPPVTGG